jgi:predicted HAD superfamily Cof-like phosphohydrolase
MSRPAPVRHPTPNQNPDESGHGFSHPAQRDIAEFHRVVVGIEDSTTPAIRRPELRAELIREEAQETVDAILAGDLVGAIDGLCDILAVTYGAAAEFGIDLAPFWDEVHRTNMAKAGGPLREDGKRLKPPGWTPPDIAGVLQRLTRDPTEERPRPADSLTNKRQNYVPMRLDADMIASLPLAWQPMRRKTSTQAVRMPSPFTITYPDGEHVDCQDGWIALDNANQPYAITAQIMASDYEPALTGPAALKAALATLNEDPQPTAAEPAADGGLQVNVLIDESPRALTPGADGQILGARLYHGQPPGVEVWIEQSAAKGGDMLIGRQQTYLITPGDTFYTQGGEQ